KLILAMDNCREIPQIEVAVGEHRCVPTAELENNLRVTLTLRHLQPLTDKDLQLLREFSDEYGIEWYLQSVGPDTVRRFWPVGGDNQLQYYLPDETGDICMDLDRKSTRLNSSHVK